MSNFGADTITGSLSILLRDNDKLFFKIEYQEIKKLAELIFEILNTEKENSEINRIKNKNLLFQQLSLVDKDNLNSFYTALQDKTYSIEDRYYLGLQPFYDRIPKRKKENK
jgi:hypothetical protein